MEEHDDVMQNFKVVYAPGFMPGFMVNVKNVLNVYIILWRLEKYNLQL